MDDIQEFRFVDLIVEHFGPVAAAYVLSTTLGELPLASGADVSLELRQDARAAWLVLAGDERFVYHDEALAALVRYDVEAGMVVANAMRRATGGDLPPIVSEDPVEAALFALAVDTYAGVVVLRRWEAQRTPSVDLSGLDGPATLRSVLAAHPAAAKMTEAIRADELLSGLVTGQEPERLFVVGGAGQRLEMDSFAYLLLGAATARILSGSDVPTLASFMSTASECLAETRALARGSTVPGRATVGIAGIRLDDNARVPTPWGVLRPASGWEAASAANDVHVEVVLDTAVEWIGGWSDKPLPMSRAPLNAPLPMMVLLPVALILALRVDLFVRPGVAWQRNLGPMSGLGWSSGVSSRVRSEAFGMNVSINESHAREVTRWCTIVEERLTDRLLVTAHRLPSACYRTDMADALIDALIVWENLVGGSNDTTHRVTGGMAALVEPDSRLVKARQTELEDVYEARSAIVHGQANPSSLRPRPGDPLPIATHLETAIRTAVRGLRALLTDHQDLIPMRSSKRSDRLLQASPLRDVEK